MYDTESAGRGCDLKMATDVRCLELGRAGISHCVRALLRDLTSISCSNAQPAGVSVREPEEEHTEKEGPGTTEHNGETGADRAPEAILSLEHPPSPTFSGGAVPMQGLTPRAPETGDLDRRNIEARHLGGATWREEAMLTWTHGMSPRSFWLAICFQRRAGPPRRRRLILPSGPSRWNSRLEDPHGIG